MDSLSFDRKNQVLMFAKRTGSDRTSSEEILTKISATLRKLSGKRT